MGDVAGIGPEVVARACVNPDVLRECRPLVVGDATILERSLRLIGSSARVHNVESPAACDQTS
ncbi:MAG TPA: hypothetical protein VG055_15390, partial [Planctomycetaceae bacterium]|nr:hypothetical protein [Planctomycetaceae bacterium]